MTDKSENSELYDKLSELQSELMSREANEGPFSDYEIVRISEEDCIGVHNPSKGGRNLVYAPDDGLATSMITLSSDTIPVEPDGSLESAANKAIDQIMSLEEELVEDQSDSPKDIKKIVSLGGNIWAKEMDESAGVVRAWVDIGVIVE